MDEMDTGEVVDRGTGGVFLAAAHDDGYGHRHDHRHHNRHDNGDDHRHDNGDGRRDDRAAFAALLGDAEEQEWQERALCAQTDPEAFFPEKGGSTREAKRICAGCEVRAECLEYALAHDERFGIWGGLSERERRRLKRRAV